MKTTCSDLSGRPDRLGDRPMPTPPPPQRVPQFLKPIDYKAPTGLNINLMLDKYATEGVSESV
jgi:hypothetical protein